MYLIFCKTTHKHIATYTNEKTLENLDLNKCYYKKLEKKIIQAERSGNEFKVTRKEESKKTSSSTSGSNCVTNDYMNPANPIGYHATVSSYSSSSSDCGSSSSSSSYDSGSSSCDSSSW